MQVLTELLWKKVVIKYLISKPMWSSRSIGLVVSRLDRNPVLDVSITHKDVHGNRMYPDEYRVTKEFAEKYPKKLFRNMKEQMYVIPIDDLPLTPKEDI